MSAINLVLVIDAPGQTQLPGDAQNDFALGELGAAGTQPAKGGDHLVNVVSLKSGYVLFRLAKQVGGTCQSGSLTERGRPGSDRVKKGPQGQRIAWKGDYQVPGCVKTTRVVLEHVAEIEPVPDRPMIAGGFQGGRAHGRDEFILTAGLRGQPGSPASQSPPSGPGRSRPETRSSSAAAE